VHFQDVIMGLSKDAMLRVSGRVPSRMSSTIFLTLTETQGS
jgi:hypothetical protein